MVHTLRNSIPLDQPSPFSIQVFFDGDCPLCLREVAMLARLDRRQRRIWFTDIAAPDFDARAWGTTQEELMAQIAGRLPDGTWVTGVEVFRRLYAAVGFGPAVALSRLPGVSGVLDVAYRTFARNRLRWTGRCDPETGCAVKTAAS